MNVAHERERQARAALQQLGRERDVRRAELPELDRRDAESGREWFRAYNAPLPLAAGHCQRAAASASRQNNPRQEQQLFHCPRCEEEKPRGSAKLDAPGGKLVCTACYSQSYRRRKKDVERDKQQARQRRLRNRHIMIEINQCQTGALQAGVSARADR
ncbi:unnamed protein product [Tilletia laevis]|uniref:Uncharacterized protein n=2 Tax=Tilletia TaxID=13289 RepID=A0A9N8Q5T3_9BASI|nr:hypothetical protein CF335_g5654 [Tilletia laevis]CAD6890232.1 unnamed protein product [Tilletia caries]CAD6943703.1 unnamed protein product [Tilletia controversa]CAD6900266.1 unnamed protein product [Tilletia laevis]CAD6906011.1 unnamed protein product [Tilletia caries]